MLGVWLSEASSQKVMSLYMVKVQPVCHDQRVYLDMLRLLHDHKATTAAQM